MQLIIADYNNTNHANAIIALLREYMTDPMGDCTPHSIEQNQQLIDGLRAQPNGLTFLVMSDNQFMAMAVCFVNFATFTAKRFINIHDFIVSSKFRKQGVGKFLMQGIIEKANELNCSKITLEVRNDNAIAQQLYTQCGFAECTPPMHFWIRRC